MQFRSALAKLAQLTILTLLTTFSLFAQNINTTYRSKISYPGQTLANIWGYTSAGKEYALVGGSQGLIIVDITNPDVPQQIVQIPGPNNLWKEIKTYQHYAYVTSEGGGGIQVVDLAGLPSPMLTSHFYTGDGAILGQLGAIHALHIDETKGFLYAWGGNLFGGGAKIFDLKADPYNPVYVGKYDQLGYIHDGYVDNDTMYSCHIYAGQFAIVNMVDKSAPELINTQTTPNAFPHNTWLTPDRHTLLSTDEKSNSFLAAYDISDPTDIKFLDKIQGTPGSGSIVHNTYAMDHWAISSWYKDGFTMVDVTRPDNLVQVGNYDTYPNASGDGFEGCWGVYPFFPSGTLIASNIGAPGELYIVSPNYIRACYVEGNVKDAATGLPIQNAQIQVIGSNPLLQELSAGNGDFKMGQSTEGYFTIRISKAGYQDFENVVYLQHGEVVTLNVALFPIGQLNVSGTVVRHSNGVPVQGAKVWLFGDHYLPPITTDAAGMFVFSNVSPGNYTIAAGGPTFGQAILAGQVIVRDTSYILELTRTKGRDSASDRNEVFSGDNLLKVNQNPFASETILEYDLPVAGASLTLLNNLGQTLETYELNGTTGQLSLGMGWPVGTYFAVLSSSDEAGAILEVKKLVKSH